MSEWLPYVLTIVGSVGGAAITFYVSFERFRSMDTQRLKDWVEWRARLEERVDRIDNRLREHERYCDGRWNESNREMGMLQGRMRREDER